MQLLPDLNDVTTRLALLILPVNDLFVRLFKFVLQFMSDLPSVSTHTQQRNDLRR